MPMLRENLLTSRLDERLRRMADYEAVHTITDWYDGPRQGVADLHGEPHYYENHWYEGERDWSEIYLLQPLDPETFALAMEDWEIWLRWENAFKEGKTTHETHPALPEDRKRHEELEKLLSERLVAPPETSIKARADFVDRKVKWSVIEGAVEPGKPIAW